MRLYSTYFPVSHSAKKKKVIESNEQNKLTGNKMASNDLNRNFQSKELSQGNRNTRKTVSILVQNKHHKMYSTFFHE